MRKSIIVLTTILVAGTMAHTSGAEARGLRIGIGFGVPFGPGHGRADPTILERLDRQRYKTVRTHESASYERRQAAISAAKARAQERAAERHAAAKEAAAKQAQLQAREATVRKQTQVAKTAVIVPAIAPVAVAVIPAEERALEVAQEQQRAKAEQLLKSLSTPAQQAAPGTVTVAPVAPRIVVAPSIERETVPAPVVTPLAIPAAAKVIITGECKRFIPGAGITISVPCSE